MTWGLICLAKEALSFSDALKFEFRKVFVGESGLFPTSLSPVRAASVFQEL